MRTDLSRPDLLEQVLDTKIARTPQEWKYKIDPVTGGLLNGGKLEFVQDGSGNRARWYVKVEPEREQGRVVYWGGVFQQLSEMPQDTASEIGQLITHIQRLTFSATLPIFETIADQKAQAKLGQFLFTLKHMAIAKVKIESQKDKVAEVMEKSKGILETFQQQNEALRKQNAELKASIESMQTKEIERAQARLAVGD